MSHLSWEYGSVNAALEASAKSLDNVSSGKITKKAVGAGPPSTPHADAQPSSTKDAAGKSQANGTAGLKKTVSSDENIDSTSLEEGATGDAGDLQTRKPQKPAAGHNKLVSDVMSQLEKLIMSDDWIYQTQGKEPTVTRRKKTASSGPGLDELGRSVLTSYSLLAYIRLLHPQHRNALSVYLYHHTASALTKLCRFPESTLYFHDEKFEGLLRVIRIALHCTFPQFDQEGIKAFAGKSPMVYVSPSLPYSGIERFLTFELGFLEVCILPSSGTDSGVVDSLDVSKFSALLKQHEEEKKAPVILLASAGFPLNGKMDDVKALLELREKHKFWFHLDGLNLAALCLETVPQPFEMMQQVDSAVLPLGQWLGVPAVPFVTIHRSEELFTPNNSEKLASLPWWVVTRHLTAPGIRERLEKAFKMMSAVIDLLLKRHQLAVYTDNGDMMQILKNKPKEKSGSQKTPTPPVLLFRYIGDIRNHSAVVPNETESDGSPSSSATSDSDASLNITDQYVDSVNTWLGQGLLQECPNMGFHNVGTQRFGLCIRFCPLETANALGTTEEQITAFSKQLSNSLSILDATVRARNHLPVMLKEYPALIGAEVPKWAGVGSVIYVPSMLRDVPEWNDKQRQQVSHLNIELVHELRSSDTAFSVGQTDEAMSCVKFGMLADDSDLRHLVDNVAKTGLRIEESSQYIESLAQLVRQGIEAANIDLKKENEQKLVQEGVLRQVPLVGSFLNWFAPLPKENLNVRGRSFDLVSGQIQSTEAVYQQHLQIQRAAGEEQPVTHFESVPEGVEGENKDTPLANKDTELTTTIASNAPPTPVKADTDSNKTAAALTPGGSSVEDSGIDSPTGASAGDDHEDQASTVADKGGVGSNPAGTKNSKPPANGDISAAEKAKLVAKNTSK